MKYFAVWGTGRANSEIVKNGEPSKFAAQVARNYGFKIKSADDWAVLVWADEDELDAQTRFDKAVLGWAEAHTFEEYVVLASTPHGTPTWYTTTSDKELNKNLTTIKVLGPYAIGPEGYDSPEEAVFCDPSFSGSLYEPDTWEED